MGVFGFGMRKVGIAGVTAAVAAGLIVGGAGAPAHAADQSPVDEILPDAFTVNLDPGATQVFLNAGVPGLITATAGVIPSDKLEFIAGHLDHSQATLAHARTHPGACLSFRYGYRDNIPVVHGITITMQDMSTTSQVPCPWRTSTFFMH